MRAWICRPATSCHPARQSSRAGVLRAGDYRLYRQLIAAAARRAGAEIWAYCLMPNHVHLIVTPTDQDGLRATFGRSAPPLHRGDQRSVPMDGPSIPGPLRRGGDGRAAPAGGSALHRAQSGGRGAGEPCRGLAMVERSPHLAGEDDELATVAPLRALIPDFAALLEGTCRPRDDGSDRAGTDDRTAAWRAGMDRGARAAARPAPGTR